MNKWWQLHVGLDLSVPATKPAKIHTSFTEDATYTEILNIDIKQILWKHVSCDYIPDSWNGEKVHSITGKIVFKQIGLWSQSTF